MHVLTYTQHWCSQKPSDLKKKGTVPRLKKRAAVQWLCSRALHQDMQGYQGPAAAPGAVQRQWDECGTGPGWPSGLWGRWRWGTVAVCCAVLCSTCLLEGGQLGHGRCACAHGPGLAGRLRLGCHHSHHLFISSSLFYLLIYFNPLLGFWSLLEVKYKPRSQISAEMEAELPSFRAFLADRAELCWQGRTENPSTGGAYSYCGD